MARRASPSRSRSAGKSNSDTPVAGNTPREKIVNALMALLAENPIEEIGLPDIAARAGLSLADMRDEFDSVLAIFRAYIKSVDRAVLAGGDADMVEESPREQLFDVLMRRLEALTPHKAAIHSLLRSAVRNPGLAFALNGVSVRSQHWMLTAASIEAAGPKGMIRAQGMALLFGAVLRVWVRDDDPGLARTMAELDRELSRGQRWAGFLDDLCAIPESACRARSHWRARRRRRDEQDDAEVAA